MLNANPATALRIDWSPALLNRARVKRRGPRAGPPAGRAQNPHFYRPPAVRRWNKSRPPGPRILAMEYPNGMRATGRDGRAFAVGPGCAGRDSAGQRAAAGTAGPTGRAAHRGGRHGTMIAPVRSAGGGRTTLPPGPRHPPGEE